MRIGAGLLLCRSQGHVDRGRGPGFKGHSDPGMATRPQAGQCQTHHRPSVQEARGQGNGVVFPGSRTHSCRRKETWTCPGPGSLPAWAVSTLALIHTCVAMGGLPSSQLPPYTDRLGLRAQGTGGHKSRFQMQGSTRFRHLGSLPVTFSISRAPCSHWVHFHTDPGLPLHSRPPQCPWPTGTWNPRDTSSVLGSQAGGRSQHSGNDSSRTGLK